MVSSIAGAREFASGSRESGSRIGDRLALDTEKLFLTNGPLGAGASE